MDVAAAALMAAAMVANRAEAVVAVAIKAEVAPEVATAAAAAERVEMDQQRSSCSARPPSAPPRPLTTAQARQSHVGLRQSQAR